MQTFLRVVDAGSFARAADQLGMSSPAVTRHIAALEKHLGARLLQRSTRRLSLTSAGAQYAERCRTILADIDDADALAGDQTRAPAGRLRVAGPVGFGALWLAPWIAEFRARYPELILDVTLSDRVDLIEDGLDCGIGLSTNAEADLVARPLADVRLLACAAPAYLARRGTPRHPDELAQHDCLDYAFLGIARESWPFERAGELVHAQVRGVLHANNVQVIRAAALAGLGIALEPSFIVGDDLRSGRLQLVLPQWQSATFSLGLLYPSRRHLSAKVRVFGDFLVEKIGTPPIWERGLEAAAGTAGALVGIGPLPRAGRQRRPPTARAGRRAG